MKENILLKKQVFKNNIYENVIDTSFKELISTSEIETESPKITINDFFKSYDELFYDIQKTGDSLSHEYLITKSTQYIGENKGPLYLALQEEITSLKKELLNSSTVINDLTQQLNLLGDQIKVINNNG